MTGGAEQLVVARGVVFDYPGSVRALDGVDFAVARGELVAVLGPNGSGKSTLVRVLAGLARPLVGTVELGGVEAARLSTRDRARRVAVVPQGLPHIPAMRVRDFVLGGRYAHLGIWRTAAAHDAEVVESALARVCAEDCAERLLIEMSGGQRQRVLVARALAQEAELVLFDEPTAMLDPEHQILVMELVRELAEQGRGVAVITHDFNLASQYANRVTLLDRGRVAASGSVEAVLQPDQLSTVYGPRLWFGRLPGPSGRPIVIARRDS